MTWRPPHASLLPIVRAIINYNLGRCTPCCLGSRLHVPSASNLSNRSISSNTQSICSVSSPSLDLDLYQGTRHNGVWSQRPLDPSRPFKGRQQRHLNASRLWEVHYIRAQAYMLDMLNARLNWDTHLPFLVCSLDNPAFRVSLRRSSYCPLGSQRIIVRSQTSRPEPFDTVVVTLSYGHRPTRSDCAPGTVRLQLQLLLLLYVRWTRLD
jgi:hypothetical protein